MMISLISRHSSMYESPKPARSNHAIPFPDDFVAAPPQARISVPKPFVVGQSGTLACEAFGDSPIQLSWVIGNATMTLGTLTTGRLSATYDRGATKTTLTIKNITLQDEGLIYCEATNNRIIDLSKRSDLAQFYYNPTGMQASNSVYPFQTDTTHYTCTRLGVS